MTAEGTTPDAPDGVDRAWTRVRGWGARRRGGRLGGGVTGAAVRGPVPGDDAIDDAGARAGARIPEVGFEDRMGTVEFRVAPDAHIVVDGDSCRGCTTRACVSVCPANLFVPTSDGGILFNYEQCFECGACYLVCNTEGAITWRYPEGGHGVVFRRS